MNKSLLLGSVAALVIAPGAFAADLPVVEPVDYVKVCDAFGAGFHYIPGTETCLKFSGRVRAEIGINGGDTFEDGVDDPSDRSFLNSNFELVVNASSMTEIGMVVGQFAISASNEAGVSLGDAWITIGENILVGRETSRFDFGGGYGIYDGYYGDEGLNQFTFIMPFGNGVSATIGLENNNTDRNAGIANTGSRDGMEIPEIVASLRISQGWGSAQISGALHQNRVYDASGSDEEFGFAVQAGVELNVGAMTKVKVVGAYADGALRYVGGSDYNEVSWDGANDRIDDTAEGWYVLAALSHDFSDQLNFSLTGAYHDFDDQAEVLYIGSTVSYEIVENLTIAVAGYYQDVDPENAVSEDTWQAKLRINRSF